MYIEPGPMWMDRFFKENVVCEQQQTNELGFCSQFVKIYF